MIIIAVLAVKQDLIQAYLIPIVYHANIKKIKYTLSCTFIDNGVLDFVLKINPDL